jgi:hypothetical protein
MPPTAPYPLVSDIMNAARTRVNDAIASIGGQTLKNNQPFTGPLVALAWQRLQQFLVGLGYVTLESSLLISGLPPAFTNDPGVEVSLSWLGYFDGNTLNTAFVLPQNLIRPMKDGLEQRLSLNNPPVPVLGGAVMTPMDETLGPMAHVSKDLWLRQWQWREDAIWMTGALAPNDVRIRFAKYLADLDVTSSTAVAPIMRCTDALSGFIAVEFSGARGDLDRAALLAEAEANAAILAAGDNGDTRLAKSSERGKMVDRYSKAQAVAQ